jgi:hypothetical protein
MIARGRDEKVRVMRALRARKLSARDIGRLVGVSHQRVSQVIGEGVRAVGVVRDAAKQGGVTAAPWPTLRPARGAERRQTPDLPGSAGSRQRRVSIACPSPHGLEHSPLGCGHWVSIKRE